MDLMAARCDIRHFSLKNLLIWFTLSPIDYYAYRRDSDPEENVDEVSKEVTIFRSHEPKKVVSYILSVSILFLWTQG